MTMPLCVLALLAVVVATPPAPPQCNIGPGISYQFRSSILDLAVDGNDLWAATSYGVSLYDRALDPPRLVASLAVPGNTRLVRLGSGVVYAGSGNTIAVIGKNGRSLQLLRTVDAGAPVNDMLFTGVSLYVATRNGITLYSAADPSNPTVLTTFFPNPVTSLAMIGATIYAADGDTSVEVFSGSPVIQRLGGIATASNVTSVHVQNGKLYVSSILGTTVFVGSGATMTAAGTVPFSTTSIAPIAPDAMFMSSTDRTLRAIDFTTPGTPIDLFRDEAPASNGTVNRVSTVVTAGSRLYAAAGDSGIAEYDISIFTPPFPLRGSAFPNASSIVSVGNNFYVGRTTGIAEFSQSLVPARTWDGSRADVVQDGDGTRNFLLSSSGTSMTLWTLVSTIPQPVAAATFRAPVAKAVLIWPTGYAVLTDRTLWSADYSQAQPVPVQLSTPNINPSSIARAGNSIALADIRSDGTTLVAYSATPDFSGEPKSATIAGLATSGVALSSTTAAIQTFRGISLIEFNSGIVGVLPQSNTEVARQLMFFGSSLLELTDTSVKIWNVLTQKVSAEITLPAQPIAMHIAPLSNIADIVTTTGVVTIALDRTLRMPAEIVTPNGNAFYKKVLASKDHIDLFDGRNIDIYSSTLDYIGSVQTAGVIDVAAGDSGLFTLSGNLTVAAYTPDGILRSTASITESGAQASSINSVNGAAWVSIVRGCTTSGACEKKTIVFDARNALSQTVTMPGGVTDVAVVGDFAYAITDLPAEIRVIDVTDPFHAATIVSRAAEGSPLSIAYSAGTIYVLGNTLTSYSETNLARGADLLGTYTSDGSVTFADQHIRVSGFCGVVTGRTFGPSLLSLLQGLATSFTSPSPARSVAMHNGVFFILTDHSLEIWNGQLPRPARRAPAR